MKRFFALLLAAAMLAAFAVPVSAKEATYKVADVSQVAYIEDDGRLDLSKSVSRVPYGKTMYFPLLNGGASGVDEAKKAYEDAEKAYGDAKDALAKAVKAVEEATKKRDEAEKAYYAEMNKDTTALQNALDEAKAKRDTLRDVTIPKLEGELTELKGTKKTQAEQALAEAEKNAPTPEKIESLRLAMEQAKSAHDTAVRLDGLVTDAQSRRDEAFKLDSGAEHMKPYEDALTAAKNNRANHSGESTASLKDKYDGPNGAKAAYETARDDKTVENARDALNTLVKVTIPAKENELGKARSDLEGAETAVKTAERNLANAKPDQATLDRLLQAWNDAKDALKRAEGEKADADKAVAAAPTEAKVKDLKATWENLRNNRYKYVYESDAAGDATTKVSWEDNSGRYLGTPTVKRVRTAETPTGSSGSTMNYIYCVAIKVNERSATDSRDVFGKITVKQTKGDRENRFDNVVLDLAVEIGYKDASDTDLGSGTIPKEAAYFRKGEDFDQDSEFIFDFEADPDSSFVVNTVGQGNITLGFDTDPDEKLDEKIYREYGADVEYFNGNYATFNRMGTLYLAPSDGEDNYYVYSIAENGNVARVSAEWDSSEDAYAIKTRTLGRYFLSSERLSSSFLSSINGGSSGSSSKPSGGSSSSGSAGSGDLVVVPAPSTPTTTTSTPTYNPPASSSQASSSSPSSSSSSSSSEEASEPEDEDTSEPDDEFSSEPEDVVDVDTDADDSDGPKKGGSALVWVLVIVGLLAAGGVAGFVIYQNKVKRRDDGYSEYDEYNDDNDFPDDDDRG